MTEKETPQKPGRHRFDGPGPGRPKGVPNKSTTKAREAIAAFVDGNAGLLQEWLERIAEDNPGAAFDRFMSVVEYHIPKLARTEHTGENGGAIKLMVQATQADELL